MKKLQKISLLIIDSTTKKKKHEKIIILFDVITTTPFPIVIINYIIMHQLKPLRRALKALFCSPPKTLFPM